MEQVELVRRLFTDPRFAPPEQAPARGAGARSARRGARQEERQRQNVTVSRFGERMGPGNVTGNDGDMGIKLICPTQIRDWNGLTYQKLWIRL